MKAYAVLGGAVCVVRVQHLAQSANLDARIAIGLGIEIGVAPQPLDGDGIGFQFLAAARKRPLDEEAQQLTHHRRTLEFGRAEDRLELGHDPAGLGFLAGVFLSGHTASFQPPSGPELHVTVK